MDTASVSPTTYRTRIPGDVDPDMVHVGDLINAMGQEATVRTATTDAAWPLAPSRWTFDAVALDGTEVVAVRGRGEPVHVVRAACPWWSCPLPGCPAHGRSVSWLLADAARIEHRIAWHEAAA